MTSASLVCQSTHQTTLSAALSTNNIHERLPAFCKKCLVGSRTAESSLMLALCEQSNALVQCLNGIDHVFMHHAARCSSLIFQISLHINMGPRAVCILVLFLFQSQRRQAMISSRVHQTHLLLHTCILCALCVLRALKGACPQFWKTVRLGGHRRVQKIDIHLNCLFSRTNMSSC